MNPKIFFNLQNCLWLFVMLNLFACQTPVNSNEQSNTDTTRATLSPNPDSVGAVAKSSEVTVPPDESLKNDTHAAEVDNGLTYEIIPADSSTFGYNIYKDGKLMIHQPSIPALPGNKGFETQQIAMAVAQLVMTKITNGEMPPTVSTEELKKLGVKVK